MYKSISYYINTVKYSSASAYLTNYELKEFGGGGSTSAMNVAVSECVQPFSCHCSLKNKHNGYLRGIKSSRDDLKCKVDVRRPYANTMPSHSRDLSIFGF